MNNVLVDRVAEGIYKGRIEGKIERETEIVKNALEEGATIEFIKKITGLTLEEIQKIQDGLNNQ